MCRAVDPTPSFAWTPFNVCGKSSSAIGAVPKPDPAQPPTCAPVIDRCRDACRNLRARCLPALHLGTTANIGVGGDAPRGGVFDMLASPVWIFFLGGAKRCAFWFDDEKHAFRQRLLAGSDRRNITPPPWPYLDARGQNTRSIRFLFPPRRAGPGDGCLDMWFLIRDGELFDSPPSITTSLRGQHGFPAHARADLGYKVSSAAFRCQRNARTG